MQIFNIDIHKNKVILEFKDDKERLEISQNIFCDHCLYIGKEISDGEIKKIKHESKVESLIVWSKKYLSRNSVSCFAFKGKLANKGVSYTDRVYIANKMADIGLINDKEYADEKIYFLNRKGYGRNFIINKLYSEGISSMIVNKIDFSEKEEVRKLGKRASKYIKVNKKKGKENLVRNLGAYLSRNGFDSYLIKNYVIVHFGEEHSCSLL